MALPMIDTGYKPEGALGALYQGFNAGAAEEEQRNQMMASQLENVKRFLDSQKQAQEMPEELKVKQLAGSQAAQQNTPEMLRAFAEGKLGGYQKDAAEGQFAKDTVGSKTTATNQKNINEGNQAAVEQFLRGSDVWRSSGGNPMVARAQGLSEDDVLRFGELQRSGKLGTVVETLKKNLQDSVAQRQAIEKERVQSQARLNEIGAQGANARELEQMRIDAGKYKKADQLNIAMMAAKSGNYERASVTFGMMAFQATDPDERQAYLTEASKYEQMAKEKAMAGRTNPGAIDVPSVAQLPGQQITPSRMNPSQVGTKENPIKLD